MTFSAPRDFTNATLVVLHIPVTSAPKCLASCTAEVPTAPDAPVDQHFLSALDLQLFSDNARLTCLQMEWLRLPRMLHWRVLMPSRSFSGKQVYSAYIPNQPDVKRIHLVTLFKSFYIFAYRFNSLQLISSQVWIFLVL